MAYWILKTEPEDYSYNDLERAGRGVWDGIRSHQARGYLEAMKRGDLCLVYHTGKVRQVAGVAEVVREAYPDPSAPGDLWLCVDVAPLGRLGRPVTLAEIKADRGLSQLAILRQSRLSVAPVTPAEWRRVMTLSRQSPHRG
jgi:predicted RNA-binding protein with PUA-like domain